MNGEFYIKPNGATWQHLPNYTRVYERNLESNNNNNGNNNGTMINIGNIANIKAFFRGTTSGAAARAASPQLPNVARKAARKWRQAAPREIQRARVNVKLPANASDFISFKNFNRGNEAIMVIKKRVVNGRVRPKRYYIQKATFARLAGRPWTQAVNMPATATMFRDPLNRRTVYRRNVMNVKFV